MQSAAKTVEEYLDSLTPERRAAIAKVRAVIRKNLPAGYREGIQFGMLGYCIPLERFPDTYNGQPLPIAALAAQKNHLALYLMGVYGSKELLARFQRGFDKAGKKLDMGKSCVRFQRADDLALDAVAEVIRAVPVDKLIDIHESVHAARRKKKPAAARKPTAKQPAAKRKRR